MDFVEREYHMQAQVHTNQSLCSGAFCLNQVNSSKPESQKIGQKYD